MNLSWPLAGGVRTGIGNAVAQFGGQLATRPMNTQHFKAPWGVPLKVISVLATGFCFGLTLFLLRHPPPAPGHWLLCLRLLPAALIIGCALFCIRGYTLTPDALMIQRLCWRTRIPLTDLQSAEFQPQAMRRSIRTFGNGGLFSFSGYYWSRALGSYRAFVTDLRQTVVLRFAARTIVVSPDRAEDFVNELTSHHSAAPTSFAAP